MTFFQSVKTCLTKYVNFEGRAARSEFWWFYLFTILVSLGTWLLLALPTLIKISQYGHLPDAGGQFFDLRLITAADSLSLLFYALFFLPVLAAAVRRFHDLNQTGWWVLAYLVPIAGPLYLAFMFSIRGTEGPNPWGDDPLETTVSRS